MGVVQETCLVMTKSGVNNMELKDAGMILRSLAESWEEPHEISKITEYAEGWDKGWNSGTRCCGISLNDLLDKCGVPELEEESE